LVLPVGSLLSGKVGLNHTFILSEGSGALPTGALDGVPHHVDAGFFDKDSGNEADDVLVVVIGRDDNGFDQSALLRRVRNLTGFKALARCISEACQTLPSSGRKGRVRSIRVQGLRFHQR